MSTRQEAENQLPHAEQLARHEERRNPCGDPVDEDAARCILPLAAGHFCRRRACSSGGVIHEHAPDPRCCMYGEEQQKRVRSATRSSSPPATPGGVTSVDQPVTRGAAATFPNLASPPPMASSLSAAPGAAASVERPDGGDRGATGRVSADGGVITHVVRLHAARRLLVGERVVAEADVHPEFADFHSSPLSSTLVAVFLKRLADGCADVPYPFGEDPALCLEKGNPSIVPVPLSSIGFSYKIAWPIDAIG